MILAIETSTPVCSVALGKPAGTATEKRIEGRGVHSERTFTFIRELLDRHNIGIGDLEAILFSHGPGSYTGLRIGAAAIKGLLFQREVPLFTLPTLFSFSIPLLQNPNVTVHSVIDARREHLYHQKIEKDSNGRISVSDAAVKEISELETELKEGDVVAGTGWDRIRVKNRERITWLGIEAISAQNLILGWNSKVIRPMFEKRDPSLFEPEYLTMAQVNNTKVR
jgi:tRNA threonylcarbamoyladenosine biosynthesis protein TsaB